MLPVWQVGGRRRTGTNISVVRVCDHTSDLNGSTISKNEFPSDGIAVREIPADKLLIYDGD